MSTYTCKHLGRFIYIYRYIDIYLYILYIDVMYDGKLYGDLLVRSVYVAHTENNKQ